MATYNTSFYDNAVKDYNKKVQTDLAQQTGMAQADARSQLQQAYVQRMQNQQALAQNLANAGIRGGASETANLNMMNTYNANRNTINSDLSRRLTELQTNANDNMFNYAQQMNAEKQQYIQSRQSEDRANAREDRLRAQDNAREDKLRKEDRDREDTLRKEDRKREDQLRKRDETKEKYNARYSTFDSVDKLRKILKKNPNMKKKNPARYTAIMNRIGFLNERKHNEKREDKKK